MTALVRTATDSVRIRSIRSAPVPPSVLNRTCSDGLARSDAATWAPFFRSLPVVDQVTGTSVRITFTVVPNCQAQVEYGPTTSYGSLGPNETSFLYATHIQQINGLTRGTLYHFRVRVTGPTGLVTYSPDDTFTTAVGNSIGRTAADSVTRSDAVAVGAVPSYTDYSLAGVTSYGGNTIDPTGVVDSTAGLNAWIAAQPSGTDATHRARYIFPPTATYKTSTGLCLANKSYVTLWGHAATSSAWLDTGYYTFGPLPDVGCTISFTAPSGSNARSGFVLGSGYLGAGSISYGQTCTDVIIRGFLLDGNAVTPGIWNSSYETVNAFEVGKVNGFQALYNKAVDIPGDFIRFRGDGGACANAAARYNWAVAVGRQGVSFVEGDGQYFEYNVMDRCGYYGGDWEPDDDSSSANRTLLNTFMRWNTFGSFGSTGVGGTLAAVANGVHIAVRDVTIVGNVVTGSTYGVYATGSQNRHLTTYVGQTIANSGAAGSDPHIQRLTFSGNLVTHSGAIAGPVFHAGGVDTLVITDNDTNLASGSFASLGPHDGRYYYTPTGVTNTGNT